MVNAAEQIAELRTTESRPKNLKIFKYLGEIFNGSTTEGKGLKILTPNRMLRRLPITLAKLKQEIIKNENENEMKLDIFYILLADQKNLQSNSIKV